MAVPTFDIVVVGGGAVGASLACYLGQAGLSVGLVDASIPARTDPLRVSALKSVSQRLLESIDVWNAMHDGPRSLVPQAYDRMCVWDAQNAAELWFDAVVDSVLSPSGLASLHDTISRTADNTSATTRKRSISASSLRRANRTVSPQGASTGICRTPPLWLQGRRRLSPLAA